MAAEEAAAPVLGEDVTELSGDVGTKYKAAAEVVQKALAGLISTQIVAGKKVVDVCAFGDTLVERQTDAVFKKEKDKGLAFPTCISVNNIACHYSPLPDDTMELAAGDVVKIDLGAHFSGFIAVAAHTMVVPSEAGAAAEPPSDAAADVMVAAWQGAQIAARMLKAGAKNTEVTAALAGVAEAYGVQPVAGTLMHQMKQFVIDGNKVIALRTDDVEQKVEECTYADHDVVAVDVAFSTGPGKPKASEFRTTVFKRAMEHHHALKLKASKYLVNTVTTKFATMPFTLRALEDEKAARMGVTECLRHHVLYDYPVLVEEEGAIVAQYKATLLLTPKGTEAVTGLPLPEGVTSSKSLPAELQAILDTPAYKPAPKTRRRRKKKGGAAPAEAEA